MMREAQIIGEKLGVQFRVSLEKRINGAQAVGQHKTSMLQDVELGSALASLLANKLQQHKATLRMS
jgi:2-dehydropantoate 2-reductase